MKVYRGTRGIDGLLVTVDDKPLNPRHDIKHLSDGGFEWTFEGDAPAQLALAILADHLNDDQKALALYKAYMRDVIANLDNDWEITSADIAKTLETIGAA